MILVGAHYYLILVQFFPLQCQPFIDTASCIQLARLGMAQDLLYPNAVAEARLRSVLAWPEGLSLSMLAACCAGGKATPAVACCYPQGFNDFRQV